MIRSRRVMLTLTAGMILALGFFFGGCGSSGTWEVDRDIDIGGTILFSSNRGGTWNLITSDFSGEYPDTLTAGIAGEHCWGIWSHDSQKVYLATKESTDWDLCVINDISNPTGSWEKLLDADGDQTFPVLTPDGTALVYLHQITGEPNPQINLFNLTNDQVTELTGQLEVKDMKFIPGTNDLMVLDGFILKVLSIDRQSIEQYVFGSDAGNGYRHESFTITGNDETYCAGRELNRDIYSLDRWDMSDPDQPEHLIDAKKGSAVNFWYHMHWLDDGGDEYILLASKPDIGSFQRWIGVIDIQANTWTTKFVSGTKTMDNVYPDWTSVEHY